MKKIIILLVPVLLLAGIVGLAAADSLSGEEIMARVYERETGEDRQATMEMVLINRHGAQRVREIKQFERDFGEVEKTIMFFLAPADVRNTSFMSWSYDDVSDDQQWLYLPALNRIRRIAGDDRSDNFMGSDFTYEDMAERHVEEDEHEVIGEEIIDGRECYVVKNIPREDGYMYDRTITWVNQEDWMVEKREFYDLDGELLKVLRNHEYEEIQGILTVVKAEMNDLQDDHKTVMKVKEVKYNTGISEDQFTERTMRMGI